MKKILVPSLLASISYLSFAQCDIAYTINPIPVLCAGNCDGQIEFEFTNSGDDAAPYVAVVENSAGVTVATHTFFGESGNVIFEDLCSGDYDVSIHSVFTPSCLYESSTTITSPTILTISSINVTHEDDGLTNGVIQINPSGGTTPYLFSINGGSSFQVSSTFSGLSAGIYNIVLMDDNGCTQEQVISVGTIFSSGCEVVAEVINQPLSCFEFCDGEIEINFENLQMISPGAPYNIELETLDGIPISSQIFATETGSHIFTNLCAGTYNIIITGLTCSFEITTVVEEPDPMVIYTNQNPPSFGEANGSIEVAVIGGVQPYAYSIDGGGIFQTNPFFYNLAEDNYNLVVEDGNGCSQTVNFYLNDPTTCGLTMNATIVSSPLCYADCNGNISYNYSDNSLKGPYRVEMFFYGSLIETQVFNSLSGSGIFSNICSGNYEVRVTDNYGCAMSEFLSVTQPDLIEITSVNLTHSDGSLNNGSAVVNATGGTLPYTYSIDGSSFSTTNLFENLAPGIYTVYVRDDNNCQTEFSFSIHNDNSCDYNIITISNPPSCAGSCDGSLNFSFNGSSLETPYYFHIEKDDNIIFSDVVSAVPVNETLDNLCAGTYILTVGNSDGCEQTEVVMITSPTAIQVFTSIQTATTGVNDGSITVINFCGESPFEYSIDNQNSWQSSPVFSNVPADNYVVWVEDANGCQGMVLTEVEDTSSCSFIVNITTTETSCGDDCDGILTCTFLDVDFNPPYYIELFKGDISIDTSDLFTDFSGLHQFTNLCTGAYTVVVKDNLGCTDKQNVFIHGPDPLIVTDVNLTNASAGEMDGSAEFLVSGGTAPYEFSINSGVNWQAENTLQNIGEGFYVLMLKDDNECITLHTFAINENPACNISTTFFQSVEVTCHDSCDAEITYGFVDAANNPPYTVELIYYVGPIETYVTSSNSFNGVLDSLCQGVYSIKVTDGDGCIGEMPFVYVTLPEDMDLAGNTTDASMNLDDGSIQLLSNGGTGQHTYSLDGVIYQDAAFFENLSPGIYQALVMDENSCEDFYNFEIFENPSCDISLNTLADAILDCPGDCDGVISYDYDDANNNPPYIISLKNSNGELIATQTETSANATGIFSGLCPGDYSVTVTDASGCSSDFSFASIAQPDYFDVDVDIIQPTDGFYNGTITLNPSGGTAPYEYSTNNQVTWSSTNTWTTLNAGFYIIYIRDANGCITVVTIVLKDYDPSSVVELGNSVFVYPNPANDVVYVNAEHIVSLAIYDVNGRLVETEQTLQNSTIVTDVSNFENGIYLFEIVTQNGEVLRTKIVKN